MRKYITTFLFITLSTLALNGQKNIPKHSNIIPEKFTESKKIILSESEAYKLLYENSKESNDRMISTIWAIIGISSAFLLAILGSQIFFNWRINKKEIDYIKKDIDEKILELKSELIKDIAGTDKEQEDKINKIFEKLEKDITAKITHEFEKAKNLMDVKEEMNTLKLNSIKNDLNNQIKALKVAVEKNEGNIWKIRGVESNALSSFLRTALLEIELGREVKFILNDIISVLSNLAEIHELDYEKLQRLTDQLKASHQAQKDKIISLFENKPVYQYLSNQNHFGFGGISGLSNKRYIKNEPQ